MKNKNGIFIGVIGLVCVILSQAGIFKAEIRPGLGLYKEITAVTYSLLGIGVVLLLIGAYQMTKAKN